MASSSRLLRETVTILRGVRGQPRVISVNNSSWVKTREFWKSEIWNRDIVVQQRKSFRKKTKIDPFLAVIPVLFDRRKREVSQKHARFARSSILLHNPSHIWPHYNFLGTIKCALKLRISSCKYITNFWLHFVALPVTPDWREQARYPACSRVYALHFACPLLMRKNDVTTPQFSHVWIGLHAVDQFHSTQ